MKQKTIELGINKAEIRDYYRKRHLAEIKNSSEFVEEILKKGMVEGCIFVKLADGTDEQFYIFPDELCNITNFVQSLSAKRIQYYQERIRDYKD